MTDRCVACAHGPHMNGKCNVCGCPQFIQADLHSARALTNINNLLASEVPLLRQGLIDLADLLCAAFPEAFDKVVAKREQLLKEQLAAQEAAMKKAEEEKNGPRTEQPSDSERPTETGADTNVTNFAPRKAIEVDDEAGEGVAE